MGFLRGLWIGSTTLRRVRKPDRISFAYYHDNQSSEPISKQQQKKGNHKKLHIDTKDMDSCSVYDILCASIVPRPIAFVSTCSLKDKVNNLAAFSFFMPVTSVPPTLAFSITRKYNDTKKDTLVNILETGHFVVNHVGLPIVDKAYQASREYDSHIDEFNEVGFTALPSKYGIAPIVKESPLSLECSLYSSMDIGKPKYGGSTIIVGKIVCLHINETSWKDNQIIPETLVSLKAWFYELRQW